MKTVTRPAPVAWPGPARRLPRRPDGPAPHFARQLAWLALATAITTAVGLPTALISPMPVRADQAPTPTPLPSLSGSSLPYWPPGVPRPEPSGLVFHDTSSDAACAQDQGEGPVSGVMVRLKDGDGVILRQQLTNSYGLYDLRDSAVGLAAGTYYLDVVPPNAGGLNFRCAKPGTAHAAVQQSPVTIASPNAMPDDMLVNVGVE